MKNLGDVLKETISDTFFVGKWLIGIGIIVTIVLFGMTSLFGMAGIFVGIPLGIFVTFFFANLLELGEGEDKCE